MIRGIYAAASGMVVATEQHETTSINLANANTPSYKEIQLSVGNADDPTIGRILSGVKTETKWQNNALGAFVKTDRNLDFALSNAGHYFLLQSENGRLLSRYGHFTRSPDGYLVNNNGHLVLGTAGPIRIPDDANNITVLDNGTIIADGEEIGRLRIVRVTDENAIRRLGATMYRIEDENGIQDVEPRILHGYTESSNIQPHELMINLILGMRFYDAALRSLRTISDMLQLNTRA
jgi:flagellar basal body rod protein FlgG